MKAAIAYSFSRGVRSEASASRDRGQHHVPALQEQRVEDLLLGGEVVVDEPVGDAGLVGDVRHAAGVKALAREHADRRVEDHPALVGGGRRADRGRPVVSIVGRRRASAGSRRRTSSQRREIEVGDDRRLAVGRAGQHEAPRVDDHRAPAGAQAAGMVSDLVGGDHEALVLDRPRPEQHLPVVARGRERERGRHGDHVARRAPPGSGTAPGSAGRSRCSARARCRRELRDHDLVTGLLGVGLGVHGSVDLDVEQVDLAVDGADARRRVRSGRWCWQPLLGPATRSTIEPATRSIPSSRAVRAPR